jgi:hypothetical protein
MANTTIRLKKSSVSAHLPTATQLEHGEIALNYADGKIFYKDPSNNIQQISGSANTFYTVNANGTLLVSTSPTDILTINPGNNIEITGNFLTDTLTIGANLKFVYDVANAAFDSANNVAPQVAPSYNTANAAFTVANAAFDKANLAASAATINVGPTPPVGSAGALWWDTVGGRLYIYYTDADSSQWVETSPSGGTVDYVALADVLTGNANTGTATVSYVIDSFSANTYRTAKYIIQGVSSSNVHSTEVLLTHNGANVFLTEYGTIFTGNSELYTVSANLYSSNVNLIINSANANTVVDFYRFKLAAR